MSDSLTTLAWPEGSRLRSSVLNIDFFIGVFATGGNYTKTYFIAISTRINIFQSIVAVLYEFFLTDKNMKGFKAFS